MRSVLKLGVVVLSILTTIIGAAARTRAVDDYVDTVLLSPEQGEALAAFAAQSEKRIRSKPDCSHLVHQLYSRAGLIYPYQDSRVLYRGISDFQRVKTPQPGDLAVWLGHVGIVLSPEEKTFLSSVHSGILTESWMAPHWVRRGRPRFYRYRVGPEADMNLLAKIMDDSLPPTETQRSTHGSTSYQVPSHAPRTSMEVETASVQQEQGSDELSRQAAKNTDESGHDSGSVVAIITQRQMPSRQQIADAILESSRVHARKLIADEMLDAAHSFSVFSRIEVEKIKIKHESGWVTLKLKETMCQEDGRILAARTVERELSIVRAGEGVWRVTDPRQHTYLADEQALEIFEHQAELFLQQAPNSSNTRIIVKALDRLYDQQADTQRAAIR